MMMKAHLKCIVFLGLITVGVSASAADAFDTHFADISILQLKPVQSELKVTESQRIKLNKHAEWLNGISSTVASQVNSGKLSSVAANKQMEVHLGTLKLKIVGELSAEQLKRLREITLQRDGLLPLMDQRMADKIGMTKAQLTKLREGYVANDKKAKELQKATFQPILNKYAAMKPKSEEEETKLIQQRAKELEAAGKKIQPQLESLGKSFVTLADATLTKGQKEAFATLKGKAFDPKKSGG